MTISYGDSARSYPERWRDWPDETRQPSAAIRGNGANSCRAQRFWQMREAILDIRSLSALAGRDFFVNGWRSEERRVGKECRSGWAPYQKRKTRTLEKKEYDTKARSGKESSGSDHSASR